MTLGQPPVIPNSSMTLDLPAHFEPDTLEYQRIESNVDSTLGLFVATMCVVFASLNSTFED